MDQKYVPKNDNEVVLSKKIQTFMYAAMEDYLNKDKGKLLISLYEAIKHNVQRIYYPELKKHVWSSTAALLSDDTRLQYITTARGPGNLCRTLCELGLHWKLVISLMSSPLHTRSLRL